jgi:hypothetical protein
MVKTTYEKGQAEGIRRSIRNLLKRRFPKSKETFAPMLDEILDLDRLDEILEFAAMAKSMAEFRKLLNG